PDGALGGTPRAHARLPRALTHRRRPAPRAGAARAARLSLLVTALDGNRARAERVGAAHESRSRAHARLQLTTARRAHGGEERAGRWGGWATMQEETARLSSDSVHEIVPGATHGSAVTDSASAAFVSAAIRDVVTAVRERRPLRIVDSRHGPDAN